MIQVHMLEVAVQTKADWKEVWRRLRWFFLFRRIKVHMAKIKVGEERKMTDAERVALEDTILRVALQRDAGTVRQLASRYNDNDDNMPEAVVRDHEALSIARQTRAAIEARFDLFTAKTIHNL